MLHRVECVLKVAAVDVWLVNAVTENWLWLGQQNEIIGTR